VDLKGRCKRSLQKYTTRIFVLLLNQISTGNGADPGIVEPEAYTILGAFFKKMSKKLRI
jgi:hypothetical protein